MRIDQWLGCARIYHSRTQATDACSASRVRINGAVVKASHLVRPGDEVVARAPRGLVVLDVKGLTTRRLPPALARELYADRSPPPPPRDEREPWLSAGPPAARDPGSGRPTKRDQRRQRRFRDGQA